MKKVYLFKSVCEFKKSEYSSIDSGCTYGIPDNDPEITEYQSVEDALAALHKLESSLEDFGKYFVFTEYWVEEVEVDDHGYWASEDGPIEFSVYKTARTIDLLNAVVDMGVDRDTALDEIDASLDKLIGFKNRQPLDDEVIPETWHDNIVFGFKWEAEYK